MQCADVQIMLDLLNEETIILTLLLLPLLIYLKRKLYRKNNHLHICISTHLHIL
jgi:hypothetical protein